MIFEHSGCDLCARDRSRREIRVPAAEGYCWHCDRMLDWRSDDVEECVPPPEVLRIMTVHFDAQYRSELAEWEEHLLTPVSYTHLTLPTKA